MRRLYLTGAGGFVGTHLIAAHAQGAFGDCELHAMPSSLDIRDAQAVRENVEHAKPDVVIHLAAQSFVPRSFEDPRETYDINFGGTLNLLSALRGAKFTGRLLYVSSGDVYGKVPESELPVTEERIPAPRNPYAVSKLATETLCRQWHFSEGLDVVIARPFNHIGPGQDPRFVVPAFAGQVVRIAQGEAEPRLAVGDIDTSRDFSDVRDIVQAYAALLARGSSGVVYNVCSGREVVVRDVLQTLCDLAGVSPDITVDRKRLRRSEQRRMVADSGLLRRDTGWAPRLSLETSLAQILDDTRTHQKA